MTSHLNDARSFYIVLYKLNHGIFARIFLELFVVMSITSLEVLDCEAGDILEYQKEE